MSRFVGRAVWPSELGRETNPKRPAIRNSTKHSRRERVGFIKRTNMCAVRSVPTTWSSSGALLESGGVIGTYHNVGETYLPLYLAEFEFRHNNRENGASFKAIVAGC